MNMAWVQGMLLLLPWATLLLAERDARKRYMPVVVLSALLMTIFFVVGYVYRWWTIKQYILGPAGRIVDLPFLYGIFPVGTFWIFYFSSRKLWLYLAVNAAVNALFSVAIIPTMLRIGVIADLKLPLWIGFTVNLTVSFILFAYFKWLDSAFRASGDSAGGRPYRTQKPRFLGKEIRHDRRSGSKLT